MMSYSKKKGGLKFFKVFATALVAFGAALQTAGMLDARAMSVLIAGSAFAGALYAGNNWRKHRR